MPSTNCQAGQSRQPRLPLRKRDLIVESGGWEYTKRPACRRTDTIVGVVFFRERRILRWRPWFAANEAKAQVRWMDEVMQESGAWSSGILTHRDLPHVALLAAREVEVFPGMSDFVFTAELPRATRATVLEALSWLSFQRDGYHPPDHPDDFLGWARHHPEGPDSASTRGQVIWDDVQVKLAALEQHPLHLIVGIPSVRVDGRGPDADLRPSSCVRPSVVRAMTQRKLVQHALEQARARGDLGDGEAAQARYLPAPYAAYVQRKAKNSDARLAKRKMTYTYVDFFGREHQIEFSLLEAKERVEAERRDLMAAQTQRLAALIGGTGQKPAFVTLTLPPSMHATTARSENSAAFDGWTVQQCIDQLQDLWRGAYQALSRKRAIAALRVFEPHTDGTPHLHAVMGDADAKALVDHILRHYKFENNQWALQVVTLRSQPGGLLERPKRNPAYRSLESYVEGRPVMAGPVGAAAQILVGEAAQTGKMVQYLVGYALRGDEEESAGMRRLEDVLMDKSSKPKAEIAGAWRQGFDLKLRRIAWTGLGGNAEQWIAATRLIDKTSVDPDLSATLRALLRAWRTDPSRSWRQHAEAFRLSFAKHDEFGYIVRDARGNQTFLRESRPVAVGSLQAMPACLQPLSGVLDASQLPAAGTDLRQLALNEQVKISDSSPRGQGLQKQGARVLKLPPRKPYPSAPDTTPELDMHDLEKIAIDGIPYKVVAAPGVGKTALYVAMLQAFGANMEPVLLLYRTRSAVRDTYRRLTDAGIDAVMALGGRGAALNQASKVTVATVDKLLHGKLLGWRGRVWIDEAQDLTQDHVRQLQKLEQRRQIDVVCVMGDARQCLMPDTTPQVFQQGWTHASIGLPRRFVRTLSVSLRCPSVIAQAATAAAPQYGAILGARQGGSVWSEEFETRRDAVVSAARAAVSAYEAGRSVVVQCDTHESCSRVREQLRGIFGPALPAGLDVRTPAQAKGGTWQWSIYLLDHDIDGRHMCARPAETLATALTRATDAASTIYYTQAA